MSKKFPATLYIYRMEDSGVIYFSAANGLDEIPDDCDGDAIATYSLCRVDTLKIKRSLEK